jgi:protein subunit release factor A
MDDKEAQLRAELKELDAQLEDPAIYSDKIYPKLAKRKSELDEVVALFDEKSKLESQISDARTMLKDADKEVAAMAEQEI